VISNAPEFLENFARAVVDEAPGYFVMLRLYQDFIVPELLQMIYMDTSLYQRFRSFKVDRPGSAQGESRGVSSEAPWFPRAKAG
jgi:hypothetical protein